MIFDLVRDFIDVLGTMPRQHPRYRILKLLNEALHRDLHFIGRHPTVVFQCLWNTCWWYDSPSLADYYDVPDCNHAMVGDVPWIRAGERLCQLMEAHYVTKLTATPGFRWVRSRRPPCLPIGNSCFVLMGHKARIESVAVSSDAKLLASCDTSGTVIVWDAVTHERLFEVQDAAASSVLFSRDSKRIISFRGSKTVTHICWASCWSVESGANLGEPSDLDKEEVIHSSKGDCHRQSALSPDGTKLARVTNMVEIQIVNVSNRQPLMTLYGHLNLIWGIAFSPDGKRLVSGSYDTTVRVWNLDASDTSCEYNSTERTGSAVYPNGTNAAAEVHRIRGHFEPVTGVAFFPDGERILSASLDKTVRVWSDVGKQRLYYLRGQDYKILLSGTEFGGDIVFSPDGERVLCRFDRDLDRGIASRWTAWDTLTGMFAEVRRDEIEQIEQVVTRVPEAGDVTITPDGFEMAIRLRERSIDTAWFPATPSLVAQHPSQPIWAGVRENHVYILSLENNDSE